MKNYRNMFLALFITIQNVGYPSNIKVSKHWNKGYNKKRSGVYMSNHRRNAHVW